MKRKLLYVVSVFALVFGVASHANAAPVVVNGSFEADTFSSGGSLGLGTSNTLTGWTTNSNGVYPWGLPNSNVYNAGPTPYGNQWVIVGDYGQGGTYIQQTVSGFTPGQTYTLDFALASELPGAGALVDVSFPTGSSTSDLIFTAPLRGNNYWDTWGTFSMNFVADSPDVTIRFLGLAGAGYDPGIDNVSIESSSQVPEPSTLLLLGSGMTGLVAMRRFRKQ